MKGRHRILVIDALLTSVMAGEVFAISSILSLAAAVAAVTLLRHLHQADPEEEPEARPDAVGPDAVRTDGHHGR